jgi:hypothetical protein
MIDLTNAIQQLRDELENLNVSIRAFERLAATGTFCKRSRSPKWPAEALPKKRADGAVRIRSLN